MTRVNWNVAMAFASAAQRLPDKTALVGTEASMQSSASRLQWSFQALLERVRHCAAGWKQLGVGPADRVLMMAHPSVDFVVAVIALQWIGAVPVFMDGGLPIERILQLVAEADAVGLLAGPEALHLKAEVPEPFRRVQAVVSVGSLLPGAKTCVDAMNASPSEPPAPAQLGPEDLVGIVFTSGSTGLPKGVEYTTQMALAGVEWLAATGMGDEDIYLAILPSHLFGSLMLGMTCVLPNIDVTRPGQGQPSAIVQQIIDCNITYTLGPPSVWTNIAAYCTEHAIAMPSLRVLNISGAAVPSKLLHALMRALPHGEVRTPLGATEGSPLTDIGAREILEDTAKATARGAGVCVGRPVAGLEIKVIEIVDRPLKTWSEATELAPGVIGELVITGPVVSKRYFKRPADTLASKIPDEHGKIWHRLGDCGYIDDQQRVWYCGRIAHIVTQRGATLYSVPVEEIFNNLPGIERTALVQPHVYGEMPVVLVVEPQSTPPPAPQEHLRALILNRASECSIAIDHILFYPQPLPVDARHNSKIERSELARWSSARLSSATKDLR